MKHKGTRSRKTTAETNSGKSPKRHQRYGDGHPLDRIQYLECKLILKGDRFTSEQNFDDFARIVKQTAERSDVGFSRKGFKNVRPQIREVLFLDTADFQLYNNAFILRRRVVYENGFAVSDPEIVFKFRHPDFKTAAEVDVRPRIFGDYRIKFKAEALPLKDQVGGFRLLYSHNVQFPLSAVHEPNRNSMAALVRIMPPLQRLKLPLTDKVALVNHTAVEEVLKDIGMLDFGKGITAKANVAVWRTRGDQKQLVGEFAYQCRFKSADELHLAARRRCEQFFVNLQYAAQEWLALETTKTGAVYRLQGNPPSAHE
ncbi:MAG: hypothetical protein JNL10_19830 [Verrucomicrobiales bacterium]|nr:hypothetical protein [Verrucomicrobiales bacterium]